MVLMSCNKSELECMLQVIDSICNKMGMCINASKTELMAYDPQSSEPLPQGVQLSGGIAKYVDVFKYLGGIVSTACDCALEVRARCGKALGRFAQMKQLWGMRRMQVTTKMKCYNAYVLPILLFGCETWALTQQQLDTLERVHSSCLRQILGVRVSDRHKLVELRKQCGTVSLADHISAARLRWFGHIVRMEHGRIPHIALFSTIPEKSRPVGKPPQRWIKNVLQDLQKQGLPTSGGGCVTWEVVPACMSLCHIARCVVGGGPWCIRSHTPILLGFVGSAQMAIAIGSICGSAFSSPILPQGSPLCCSASLH